MTSQLPPAPARPARDGGSLTAEARRISRGTAARRESLALLLLSLAWGGVLAVAGAAFIVSLFVSSGAVRFVLLGIMTGAGFGVVFLMVATLVRLVRRDASVLARLRGGATSEQAAAALSSFRRIPTAGLFGLSALAVVIVATAMSVVLIVGDGARQAALDAPTPAEVLVTEYLATIAEGDADAARAMDSGGDHDPSLDSTDRRSLLTNAALGAATEHITDVRATEGYGTTATDATVRASYTLAGESYSRDLDLRRDDEDSPWTLVSSLAVPLDMVASTRAGVEHPGFSLGGVDAEDPRWTVHAAYPAVYELVVDVDPTTLADPERTPVSRSYAVAQSLAGLEYLEFPLAE
jgi:hypothetical protein